MRYITAVLMLAGLAGCKFDLTGAAGVDVGHEQAGDEAWDMRGSANDDGCYPEALSAEHALCMCEDFDDVGELRLLESQAGQPANLGVNGHADFVSDVFIEGSLHAQAGLDAVFLASVRDDISTAGSFDWVGSQHVNGDLNVGGHLDGVGDLTVHGALRVGGSIFVVGDLSAPHRESYAPLTDPCACDGDDFFNVAIAVDDAKTINDNAAVDLAERIAVVGSSDLALPSGRFYLESWDVVGDTRLVAEGNVALFVDGSIQHVGDSQLAVAEGGSLDLYVKGSVETVGDMRLGAADPSAFRLFIGGDDAVLVGVGDQHISGYVYAPRADIELVGRTEIHGGLFARSLDGVGELTIRYAGGAPTHDDTCEEIPVDEEVPDLR